MVAKKRTRGGRPRGIGERRPCGQLRAGSPQHQATVEQIDRRAESLGIDPSRVHGKSAVIQRLAIDPSAGTALGRLIWRHGADGHRERRMADFGTKDASGRPVMEPVITEDMEAGAEAYRALWVRWHRLTGMPPRHPKSGQFERRDPSVDDGVPDPIAAQRIWGRLRQAEDAMRSCRQYGLVLAVVDSVVIEDVAPDALVAGERSTALAALRRGLDALHNVLCRPGSRK